MNEIDRAVSEFVAETRESLDGLEAALLAAEKGAKLDVAAMFRGVHTIKGTAGFLAFGRIERLAHAAEGLLGALRDGRVIADRALADALLSAVDALRGLVADVERTGAEADRDVAHVLERLANVHGGRTVPGGEARPDGPDATVRVDVRVLDGLMDVVGELVLVRNQLLRLANEARASEFLAPIQRLDHVVAELQQGVTKTRMQPIANAWGRLPRVVRDLASRCGKRVRVETDGGSAELDRTVLEAVKDPLVHLVRNAVDHGIEAPADRVARGKLAEGRITLRARHEGGAVNVEVADDGAGIDWSRVASRAVALGLLAPEDAARADERALAALLFQPGFTTGDAVTLTSGRGVGLDVVKANVERIGGSVELGTRPGEGTTVRLKIPLTLAIIPALVVTNAGRRFLIPQANVLEIIAVEGDLERVVEASVYRLRGRLLPVLDLQLELGGSPAAGTAARHLVFLVADERTFGLLVESVVETEEIVVKPLPPQVKETAFAGATVLGDGRVALILDVPRLARRAGVAGPARATPEEPRPAAAGERHLLVEVCGGERAAIPLDAVARLEELPLARIERAGGVEVAQYGGEIITLVRVSTLLGGGASTTGDAVPVVVHVGASGSAGLIVERIVDVVDEPVSAGRAGSQRTGVAGTAVLQGRVTRLLDVPALVAAGIRADAPA